MHHLGAIRRLIKFLIEGLRLADFIALLSILFGVMGMAFFVFDYVLERSASGVSLHLKPNNACSFIFAGLALLLADKSGWKKNLAIFCAGIVILFSGFAFLDFFFQVDFGTDHLIPQILGLPELHLRVSALSSLNFVLVGSSLLFFVVWHKIRISQAFALITGLIGTLGVVAYLYGTIMRFGTMGPAMSFSSAVAFVVLALGLVFRAPSQGYAGDFCKKSVGSWAFRRLLPVAVIGPAIIGWLQLRWENSGLFDSAFRIAFMMVVLALFLSLALWQVTQALDMLSAAREKAEGASRESEEKYRLLTENSVSAIASHEIVFDENGKAIDYVFLSANPAFETQTGVKRSSIVGKSVIEIVPKIRKTDLIERYGKVVSTGIPDSFETYIPDLDKYFFIHAYKIGERQFAVNFADVTEVKRAEQALRAREELLSLLVETIPIPVYYKNKEGKYVFVNKAFETLFWKKREDFLGKTAFDANPKNLAEIYNEDDQKLFKSKGTSAFYSQVQDSMGILHDVIFQKASVVDADGAVIGVIGAILNLTDQKRLEDEVKELRQQLEEAQEKASKLSKKLNVAKS